MQKNEGTAAFLIKALRQNFVFASLGEHEVQRVVERAAERHSSDRMSRYARRRGGL